MKKLTEEELRELAKRRPAIAAYLLQRRAEKAEREQQQKAEREAAIMDKMDGVFCGGIEEGYRSSTGEVIRERRFSAPTQQPSPQTARRAPGEAIREARFPGLPSNDPQSPPEGTVCGGFTDHYSAPTGQG